MGRRLVACITPSLMVQLGAWRCCDGAMRRHRLTTYRCRLVKLPLRELRAVAPARDRETRETCSVSLSFRAHEPLARECVLHTEERVYCV